MFIDESEAAEELQRLTRELENFQDIAQQLVPLPGEVPTLEGFDIWGGSLQMSGSVGGDHITYIDFKTRFDLKARIDRARAEGRPTSSKTWNAASTREASRSSTSPATG